MSPESGVTVIAAGVFVGILGLLIRYAGWTWLIAGYDPERVADEDGLANFVGSHVLAIAALTVVVGLLETVAVPGSSRWYWIPYVVAVFALAARIVRGSRRFEVESGTA